MMHLEANGRSPGAAAIPDQRTLKTYHLYYLRNGCVVGADSIEAEDDDQAANIAAGCGQGDIVELWDAARRLRIIPMGAAVAG